MTVRMDQAVDLRGLVCGLGARAGQEGCIHTICNTYAHITHTYTYMQTHITHPHKHTCVHTCNAEIYTLTDMHIHTHMHIHPYTNIHLHTQYMYRNTHVCEHIVTYMHTHVHTCACIHPHTWMWKVEISTQGCHSFPFSLWSQTPGARLLPFRKQLLADPRAYPQGPWCSLEASNYTPQCASNCLPPGGLAEPPLFCRPPPALQGLGAVGPFVWRH